MPCELLVVNVAKSSHERGDIVVCRDTPATWGSKEGLPNWVRIQITNASVSQVSRYLTEWFDNIFSFAIVSQNTTEYQVTITKDAAFTGVGQSKQIALTVLDHLNDKWGVTLISHNGDSALLRIPKPNDLSEIRQDLTDLFSKRFRMRRYGFSTADMNTVVANGGFMSLTRQQAASRIVDRFIA